MGGAEAESDDARPLDEAAPRPQPAAVDRDRHHRQLQRAVEAGKARLERRPSRRAHARAFREDHDRPAFGDRRLGGAHHPPQRRRAARAVDRDDAVAAHHPAPERDVGSSRFSTIAGWSSIRMISSVSYIDWCLTATRAAPCGGAPSTRVRMPRMKRAHQRWKRTQLAPSARIARVPNRLTGKESRTARNGAGVEDEGEKQRADEPCAI